MNETLSDRRIGMNVSTGELGLTGTDINFARVMREVAKVDSGLGRVRIVCRGETIAIIRKPSG